MRIARSHWSPIALALSITSTSPQAQDGARLPAADATSTTTAVLVDVVVRDRQGRPVTDLTESDFVLRENGAVQRVGSFTRVAQGTGIGIQVGLRDPSLPTVVSPPTADGHNTAPDLPAQRMTTALVFDALSASSLTICQRAALEYLPRSSTSDARVGVFVTEPFAQVMQAYTDHPALVRQAVSRVLPTGTALRDQLSDVRAELRDRRNRLETEAEVAASATGAQLGTSAGNVAGLEMQRRIVQGQLRMVNAFDSMDRDYRGLGTTSSLFAVLQTLVEVPGRKTLVFFSEGLPVAPSLQAHLQAVIETANRLNVTVYAVDAKGLRALSSTVETRKEIEEAGNTRLNQLARTRDDAEEPMTRLLERTEDLLRFDSQGGLARLAESTGGFLVQDTNDLTGAFQRIDEDMRFHYLLTYEPTNQALDGTFRNIGVKVKRKGVNVFARKGYRALRLPPTLPVADYEAPALAALEARKLPADVPFGAAALSFPEPARSGLVLPVVRVRTDALTYEQDARRDSYHAQATVVVRFKDERGRIVEKVSQQYQLTGRLDELPAARHGEILFYKEPVLPPGVYTMETAVHDGVANRAGVRVATVQVPAQSAEQPRLSSLVLVRRSEHVQSPAASPDRPLQVGDLLLYPATGEPVSRSKDRELAFYFVFYPASGVGAASGDGESAQRTFAIELRRHGRAVSEVSMPLAAADSSGRVAQVGRLPLEALPAGLYELGLRIGRGGAALQRSTYFTVVE